MNINIKNKTSIIPQLPCPRLQRKTRSVAGIVTLAGKERPQEAPLTA